MKVLIVKLTSMGDLVQALPAVTDASRALPDLSFDWVVDEVFAEVPAWHPAVNKIINTAHRRWREGFLQSLRQGELKAFMQSLRAENYDLVIDAQTNLKSAFVTAFTRGPKHGPDKHSVREYPAHWAYRHHYPVAKDQLAVDRWRQMFADILGYQRPDTAPDFGIEDYPWPQLDWLPEQPYLVFVANASWPTKNWTVAHWRQLIARAGDQGFQVLLPWGSQAERQLTEPLAEGFEHARVLPKLSLSEVGSLLLCSAGAISMDTGLAHISAALDVPTVTLYGPTDAGLIGATGRRSVHVIADGFDCIPCYRRECRTGDYRGPEAQCLKAVATERVWEALDQIRQESGKLGPETVHRSGTDNSAQD